MYYVLCTLWIYQSILRRDPGTQCWTRHSGNFWEKPTVLADNDGDAFTSKSLWNVSSFLEVFFNLEKKVFWFSLIFRCLSQKWSREEQTKSSYTQNESKFQPCSFVKQPSFNSTLNLRFKRTVGKHTHFSGKIALGIFFLIIKIVQIVGCQTIESSSSDKTVYHSLLFFVGRFLQPTTKQKVPKKKHRSNGFFTNPQQIHNGMDASINQGLRSLEIMMS